MTKDKNNRRQFLKNTSLAALSVAILPKLTSAKSEEDFFNNTCIPVTLDLYGQGPFYTENPPTMSENQLASLEEVGDRLIISGRVMNIGCSEFIPNTKIDVWHANDAGAYDNQGFNLRGVTYSNSQGFYVFETIKPGKYLNGAAYRPSHIHFKITPPGFPEFTTQLYFAGDEDIPADAAASVTTGNYDATNRIIPLVLTGDGLQGTWDIVMDADGLPLDLSDMHVDRGVIYRVDPNPFTDKINIRYGVFKKAQVSLLVFDLEGQKVATLEQQTLSPEQYDAVWAPDSNLPAGHYFIVLVINGLQVHYLKVIRQK